MIARRQKVSRMSATPGFRRSRRVVVFPVFENYGDMILEWLSALDNGEPRSGTVSHLAGAIERAIQQIERVRNSARHRNLATFLRHAVLALQSSEWDGARYILMTAFAALAASAVTAGATLEDPAPQSAPPVLQFPFFSSRS